MDDEQAARIDHPDGAAHVEEVAGAEAGPAGGDAGRDAGGADHEAGLVADLGIAAGRAEPYLVDRLVLSERGLEARDESVVDRALGEEERLGTLFPGGEFHRRVGALAGPGRTAGFVGIALAGGGQGGK